MQHLQLMCAMDLNGGIGISSTNEMPWHLPSDLKRFKEVTLNKSILMGSKTFASLKRRLAHRRHAVLSRGTSTSIKWLELGYSPDAVYPRFDIGVNKELACGMDVIAIGGASIFQEAIAAKARTLHITIIDTVTPADVFFPIKGERFLQDTVDDYRIQARSEWMEENGLKFQFATFTL